ncbi:DUF1127 domain-containing protein [Epibacterium ulvae]|uniref:DUF1127 domain-containing protein n=1 Tax=Epibacterium ulvae TaxID=1156985 RepID=UPI002490F342|nr:DUF1127 domain-containing protein [Epibacterium ulvae]
MTSFATQTVPSAMWSIASITVFPFVAVVRGIEAIMHARFQLQTIQHLSALSDAQLDDLGMKRDEIASRVMLQNWTL